MRRVSGDLATGIALASLIFSVPGAVLATLEVKDRLDRRRLKAEVEALKAALAAAKAEGELALRTEVRSIWCVRRRMMWWT